MPTRVQHASNMGTYLGPTWVAQVGPHFNLATSLKWVPHGLPRNENVAGTHVGSGSVLWALFYGLMHVVTYVVVLSAMPRNV